jgi:hypothetical protein
LARRRLVRALWGRSGLAENRLFLFTDWAIAPFAILTSAVCGWSALLMHRTTWAGITYEVRGPRAIDVLSRGRASPRHGQQTVNARGDFSSISS